MKCSGALCSGLELHRQYFQEHHNKFKSPTSQKSPSITSGACTAQSFKTSVKNARSPHHVSSTKRGSFFLSPDFIPPPGHGQALSQNPPSPWPSEPPALSPLHFSFLKPCGPWHWCQEISGVCVYPQGLQSQATETILREIITSDPAQKGPRISRRLRLSHG